MKKLIRCNLCGFEIDVEDDSFAHRKVRHENHHEGTELFVVGRFGDKKRRAINRITGEVSWLEVMA